MSTNPTSDRPETPTSPSPDEFSPGNRPSFRRPCNDAAEQHVISSALIDPGALDDPDVQALEPEHFASDPHRYLWRAIRELHRRGETPTLVSVTEALRTTPGPRYATGNALAFVTPARIVGLMDQADSSAFAPQHARIVRRLARLRETAELAAQAVRAAQADDADPDEVQAQLSQELTRAMRRDQPGRGGVLEDALRILEPGGGTYPTGLPDLDRLMGGIPTGLTLVAGRPSMGKTALVRQMHRHLRTQGIPSAYFMMDQTPASYYRLEASYLCGVPLDAIRQEMQRRENGLDSGRIVSDEQLAAFRAAAERVDREYPELLRVDGHPYELGQLLARIREAVRDGARVVTVDYLQQVPTRGVRLDQTTARMTSISTSLKNLANELDIAIIGVSQLSRQVEQRNPPVPRLSDLRDSGSLEQDAFTVLLCYRPEYYQARAEGRAEALTNAAQLIVPKNKEGSTGQTEVLFHTRTAHFETMSSFLRLRTPDREETR